MSELLLDQWFTCGTTIEAGIMHWRWKEWGPDKVTAEDKGPVLEADRPRRFVFQWRENSPTTVEINFESHPEGTVVRLRGTRDSLLIDEFLNRAHILVQPDKHQIVVFGTGNTQNRFPFGR